MKTLLYLLQNVHVQGSIFWFILGTCNGLSLAALLVHMHKRREARP